MTIQIQEVPNAPELEQRFGANAADYAEVRKQTVKDLGDCSRAEHWRQVEDELKSADGQ